MYPGATAGEGKHDLTKVDAAVSAEVHRIEAHLDTLFLTNLLVSTTHNVFYQSFSYFWEINVPWAKPDTVLHSTIER